MYFNLIYLWFLRKKTKKPLIQKSEGEGNNINLKMCLIQNERNFQINLYFYPYNLKALCYHSLSISFII